MEITKVNFPGNQFVKKITNKDLFIIHHSAGWDDARKMYQIWAQDTQGRVSTAYGIENDGTIYQGFDSKYWGYALYVNSPRNMVSPIYKTKKHDTHLNSRAIQVEICNWGGLIEKNNKLYSWPAYQTNSWSKKYSVPKERATFYENGFKRYNWFEKYTDEEIESLRKLILFHHDEDGINLKYNSDMWNVSDNALNGMPGIWSHVSYRSDKSDAHPQPELIQMLKEL
ncbi:MAG: N-acetylmuramoyl-L-alanine amidase [Allomuricauda sp.]